MQSRYFTCLFLASSMLMHSIKAQDSLPAVKPLSADLLPPVNVLSTRPFFTESLPGVRKTFLYAGKRSEVIRISESDINVPDKTGRQLFARIPGVFVYDMDGTGNQLNIATRGLDPHRSWEMNIRQNGVIINSDLYGYPASHYSPPLESIGQVELVRGTASLQYGPQFGGMVNYVTRSPDTTRHVEFESIHSSGTFGHLSSYLAIGGRVGRWTYHAYNYIRKSEGYREHSASKANAQYISIAYLVNSRLS
ncbi:MAG: TonB-dependent receptor, partial [Sphingobacteriales bacterium]